MKKQYFIFAISISSIILSAQTPEQQELPLNIYFNFIPNNIMKDTTQIASTEQKQTIETSVTQDKAKNKSSTKRDLLFQLLGAGIALAFFGISGM